MHLHSLEIFNFRGIRHLALDLETDTSVLIGENSWGKTSLLRAIWMLLGQGEQLCQFKASDRYIPISLINSSSDQDAEVLDLERLHELSNQHKYLHDGASYYDNKINDAVIAINLVFKESNYGAVHESKRLQRLNGAWCQGDDGLYQVNYEVRAFEQDKHFITDHYLVDNRGRRLDVDHESLIKILISMNPVLRMRDSRMLNNDTSSEDSGDLLEHSQTLMALQENDNIKASDIATGVRTLNAIVNKYLGEYSAVRGFKNRSNRPRTVRDIVNQPLSVESLSSLRRNLQKRGLTRAKILLSFITSSLMLSKGIRNIDSHSRPIIILEDIESRFHPSLLSSFYSVLELLPVQKIITTNSGDLLSATPIESLRRLCRLEEKTYCYKIDEGYLSYDDLRRIAFHIRVNRPMTLFARCWILVEGETEVWLLTEIARILGIGLYAKGIRLVEFAQCGLGPLLRFAKSLGISTFVLTDGDEAGVKYARTVQEFVGSDNLHNHLKMLPNIDIEHFFYAQGYDNIFLREANVTAPLRKGISVDKVITTAIKRKSKPGLALSIVEEIQRRGAEGVPLPLKQMYSRIVNLAQSEVATD